MGEPGRADLNDYYTAPEREAAELIIAILYQNPELGWKCDLDGTQYYDKALRGVYENIRASIARTEAPNCIVYAGHLGWSVSDIRGLCERHCREGDLPGLVSCLSDATLKRHLFAETSQLRKSLSNGSELDPLKLIDDTIVRLNKLRGASPLELISSTQELDNAISEIEDLKRRKDNGELVRLGVPTGLTALDSYIGGLTRGLITVGGAITKMGKSSFSLQVALGAASEAEPVLYFPLEDRVVNTMHRLIARETGISAQELRSLRFKTEDVARIHRAREVLAPLLEHIKFDDDAGLTAKEIGRRIRRYHSELLSQGKKLGLVVVDYIQLIKPGYDEDENVSITNSMRELQACAKETGAAILVISQLNDRKITGRGDEIFKATQEYYGYKPEFSDFKWSSSIEEFSKLVLLFHRPAFFNKGLVDDEFQIIVALSNFGESGGKVLPYIWEGRLTKIVNKVKDKRAK